LIQLRNIHGRKAKQAQFEKLPLRSRPGTSETTSFAKAAATRQPLISLQLRLSEGESGDLYQKKKAVSKTATAMPNFSYKTGWQRNQQIQQTRSRENDQKLLTEAYEFEPVRQKNGVSFVSPVARTEALHKKRGFVPRVVNKRIKVTSKGIKRGTNVHRNVTP